MLVTHTPPRGYGDLTRGSHVGDEQLLEAVQVGLWPGFVAISSTIATHVIVALVSSTRNARYSW